MKFDRDLWRRARPLFDELVELDSAARKSRLGQVGAEDPVLREAAEQLLAADAGSEDGLREHSVGSATSPPTIDTNSRDPLGVVGKTVSHFAVRAFLAAGGMGVVYTAVDLQLGRVVALKFPLPHQQVDGSVKERFINEARSAGALDHPNLCTIYEIAESEHGLFLVMPLYPGETLKDRIAREGTLPVDDALAIVQQIATGLASAHAAGIVHRDLKPGNVMLLPDGTVKVLDFGLAKIRDVSLTRSRMALGTIGYVSPEQIRGVGVDERTDLWSIGVMLYEMLVGTLPFRAEHEIAVVHGILHNELARPSEMNRRVSRQLDDLILGLLQKDSDDRYPSARVLLADIAFLRNGAAPVHRLPFWGRSARRRQVRAVARLSWRQALIVSAVLVAVAGGAVWQRGMGITNGPPVPIAVLPFMALGDSADSYPLAVGMSDAIATDLARLGGAASPSYATTSIYRTTSKSVTQIATEQRVRAVLRGSLANADGRVLVSAELLDGVSGKRLWERSYDLPLAALAELERDMLRDIASTLDLRLTGAERDSIGRPATISARAYEIYLRARGVELTEQSRDPTQPMATESLRRAQSLYSQARDLDPTFALAHAHLALIQARAFRHDSTLARREQVLAETQAALRLQPGLPEAHAALGSYLELNGDLRGAIGEFGLAARAFPHSADLRITLSRALWQDGRVEEAAKECEVALQAEPDHTRALFLAAMISTDLRRPAAAVRALDRVMALGPGSPPLKLLKGQAYLYWTGRADTLAELMRTVPTEWDPNGQATYARFTALWVQRRYADALVLLDQSRSVLNLVGFVYEPTVLMRAQVLEALGERTAARESYAKARSVLQDSLTAHPRYVSLQVTLALALAGLGEKAEAAREARRATDLAALANDEVYAASVMIVAIEVLARVGEIDDALDFVERLLSMHVGRDGTVPYLRVWPGFDALRRDPRFEKLLVRFAADSARYEPTSAPLP
ncbi:MAG TPA: protein kinase [Gemmatimonadaceae bacterium]